MRPPDYIIGGVENPYLLRWYVIPRNRFFGIYFHLILRSDDDRALHDHPWWFVSFMLAGRYTEVTTDGYRTYDPLTLRFRKAATAHRLIVKRPCMTLVITGPRSREWGFHCPRGWVHWRNFVEKTNKGNIGRGCGEL